MRGKYNLKTGVLVKQLSSELAVQQQKTSKLKTVLLYITKWFLTEAKTDT